MCNESWYTLIGIFIMFLASYVPRCVPLLFCRRKMKSVFWQSFLFYMPYAVLASLTFPGILYSTGNVLTAAVGTAVALLMSLFEINLAIVAVVCVAVVFGMSCVL